MDDDRLPEVVRADERAHEPVQHPAQHRVLPGDRHVRDGAALRLREEVAPGADVLHEVAHHRRVPEDGEQQGDGEDADEGDDQEGSGKAGPPGGGRGLRLLPGRARQRPVLVQSTREERVAGWQ